ncbi:MAG: hypothetical protein D6718_11975 [Acidobacteria bacterium]|nr:MAG: hypothetical protein D6718_11975 [Acidobacteriota bacterium]
MSPGRVIDNAEVRPYRPPRADAGEAPARDDAAELERLREELAREAREAAARELEAERERLRARLSESVAKLEALARDLSEELRREVPRLALEIAGRIVRARIEEGDPVAERVVRELLDRPLPGGVRRVRLHPDDMAVADGAASGSPSAVEFVADPSVGRGGVIVETEEEEVDARIETGFRAFWAALMEDR